MSGYYSQTRAIQAPNYLGTFGNEFQKYSVTPFPDSVETVWSFRTKPPVGTTEAESIQALLDSNVDSLRSKYDTGHPFWTEKHKCFNGSGNTVKQYYAGYTPSGGAQYYTGRVYCMPVLGAPSIGADSYAFQAFPGNAEMNEAANNALVNTYPTRSPAKLTQALLELLQDIPRFTLEVFTRGINPSTFSGSPGKALGDLSRYAGSDYLNAVFGLTPSIKDIVDICQAVVNSNKIITDFIEGSGGVSYAHWQNDPKKDPTTMVFQGSQDDNPAVLPASNIGSLGGLPRGAFQSAKSSTLQNVTKTWRFKGAWSYLLVEGSTFVENMARWEQLANHLLGTRLTIEVLWELAPWSWLVDWFQSVGNYITINSVLQRDSLVLQWGYVTFKTTQRTLNSTNALTSDGDRVNFNTFFQAERLERIRATPYGFGLKSLEFSPEQLAILAALGFSRGSGSSRY